MPIFSYLAIPAPGKKEQLCFDLRAMEFCREVIPADNDEVVILVTETPDKEADKKLSRQLNNLKSLHSLSMTYGHSDENLSEA